VSEIYTVFACRGGRNAGTAVARLSSAEKRRREFLKHSKQTGASVLVVYEREQKEEEEERSQLPILPLFWQRPSSKDLRVSPTQQLTWHRKKEREEYKKKKKKKNRERGENPK
jgi:hypothetical protein